MLILQLNEIRITAVERQTGNSHFVMLACIYNRFNEIQTVHIQSSLAIQSAFSNNQIYIYLLNVICVSPYASVHVYNDV